MRNATLLVTVLALGAVLPGAVRAQAAADAVAMTDEAAARYAARAAERDDAHAAVTFWQTLGDTTLERLIVQALAANRDLHVAAARVDAASAARTNAALDLAPSITATGSFSRQQLASATVPGAVGSLPDQDLWQAGVQMSWELDVFGRVRNSLRGRNELLASAEENVRDAEVLIAAEVAHAYFELRGAQDRLAVARRNAENQQRTLDVTLVRLEAGRGTALDTERAQAQLSSTLAVVPALEADIAAMRHRIDVLLGRPPGTAAPALEADAEMPALPDAISVASLDEVARRRHDVMSAERQLAARSALVGAAKADYLPRISIGGMAGYTASAFESLGNTGTPRYAVGPVVSWPLFDIGRVKTGVDAAQAQENEAEARYQQAVLGAIEEVRSSTSRYTGALERLEHLEAAAAASERATALARLRFEEGATDFLEVLDAERRQLETQDRLAAGRRDAMLAIVSVYRALGGQWPNGGDGR